MRLNLSASSPPWRSLRHRNYRLYLTGQLVSVCGTWMQQVAPSWLVYRLTGSATLLGVVGFASQIPILLWVPSRRDQRSLFHPSNRGMDAMRRPRSSAAAGLADPHGGYSRSTLSCSAPSPEIVFAKRLPRLREAAKPILAPRGIILETK
jgi:Transmembrane secretion effector